VRPQRTHYLRANHRETSPSRLLILDTESQPVDQGADTVQVLRLWCARSIIRSGIGAEHRKQEDSWGHTGEEAAQLIDRCARSRGTLWVYMHNSSFDLSTTKLPLALLNLGWNITQHALFSDSAWCRLRKGTKG